MEKNVFVSFRRLGSESVDPDPETAPGELYIRMLIRTGNVHFYPRFSHFTYIYLIESRWIITVCILNHLKSSNMLKVKRMPYRYLPTYLFHMTS